MPKQSKTSGQAAGNGKSQQPRATFTMVTRARSAGKTAQQKAAPSRLRKRVLAAIKGLSPHKKGHKHAKTIAEAEPDVVESEAMADILCPWVAGRKNMSAQRYRELGRQ